MWRPEAVIRALVERGELWEAAPGLVGLRGEGQQGEEKEE